MGGGGARSGASRVAASPPDAAATALALAHGEAMLKMLRALASESGRFASGGLRASAAAVLGWGMREQTLATEALTILYALVKGSLLSMEEIQVTGYVPV